MADENDRSAPGDSGIGPVAASPAAIAAALESGATPSEVGAFLAEQRALTRKQGALVDLQIARMKAQDDDILEQQKLEISHLRVRRLGDYARIGLEAFIALLILMVLIGLAAMVFSAAQDHELVFDELSVPPDLAARGINGKVMSTHLLDQFARI